VLLVLILCLQLLPVGSFAADESGSPKHIPRVVSIVFDDSGSMYNNTDRWAYTVYAMQAFAAMMGSDDILYITYLNNAASSVRVDLSDGAKAGTVSSFLNIRFGGGTPDKIQQGADCLAEEYKKHGSDANYYLVVMTDGALDNAVMSDRVKAVTSSTRNRLKGAEFETFYFSMNSNDKAIDGVKNYLAFDTTKIVGALQDVSAEVMGRTKVNHSISGGKLKFDLSYPALSIAVFAQKENGNFANFRASVQKDGKALTCQVGNYPVVSPTSINKDMSISPWQEKYPQNPPSGVVSLITNGGTPLEKGSYAVDLSGYDLASNDIVVLVEPAVRIGCKYYINDSKNPVTFEALKDSVQEGDTITVECGLYEMKADGSLGDPVPASVLSPEYKITVNGKEVATASGGANTYQIPVTKEFEDQELRVQALLKGYQPFVMKETFGKFNIKIRPVTLPESEKQVRLTKPLWQQWAAGEGKITFKLQEMDDSVPGRTAIVVEGCQGFPAGTCSELGAAVRVEGNTIVYNPRAELDFAKLPDSFTVGLQELATGEILQQVTVQVVQPAYRLEVDNRLDGTVLNLDQLKTNTAGVTFTLKVDYDGSGVFADLPAWDTGMVDRLDVNTGDLPGITETVYGSDGKPAGKRFIPQYDELNNNGIPFTKVAGRIHSITATLRDTAATAETKVETLAPDYDIVVLQDGITVTDVALRGNTEGVEFIILRDDKKLSRLELEGLAPYPLSFDKNQPWMKLETTVVTYQDGTSVLRCVPKYNGWTFLSSSLWNWASIFFVEKGEMHAVLTLGEDVAKAAVTVETSAITWTIFFVVLVILGLIVWIIICNLTYIRFKKGKFYVASFRRNPDGPGYVVETVLESNPHKGKSLRGVWRSIKSMQCIVPNKAQTYGVVASKQRASFVAARSSFSDKLILRKSIPYCVSEKNRPNFNKGSLARNAVRRIVESAREKEKLVLEEDKLTGSPCGENNFKMDIGTYLVEKDSKSIIFFISENERRKMRKEARGQKALMKKKKTRKKKKFKF